MLINPALSSRVSVVGIVFGLLVASGATSQAFATDALVRAQALFDAGDWTAAKAAYQAIVESDPDNGPAWSQLAYALVREGGQGDQDNSEKALAAWTQAAEHGFANSRTTTNAAILAEGLGRRDLAFEWLERAFSLGLPAAIADGIAPFAELRKDPRYAPLAKTAASQGPPPSPCPGGEHYKDFDFWLGDWEVSSAGAVVGTNQITAEQEGCVLVERWSASGGGSGTSFNYYDPKIEGWRQLWLDRNGNVISASGGLNEAGAMHLVGEHVYSDGRVEAYRMTFSPNEDGTVRQFVEQSKDGGKTWYTFFDGLYRRKDN